MQQPIIAVYVLWLVWILSWIGAALLTNASKRMSLAQDVLYRTMIIVGFVTLLFGFLPDPGFDVRNKLWGPLGDIAGWLLVTVLTVSILFAWWARIHIGFSLPGSSKKRAPFREKGPFKWVRHPIYAALIVGSFATALVFGRPSSLGGATLMAIAFLFKILVEEGTLRREFGSFDDYAERVPMLMPLPRFGRGSPAKWPDEDQPMPAVNLLAQATASAAPVAAVAPAAADLSAAAEPPPAVAETVTTAPEEAPLPSEEKPGESFEGALAAVEAEGEAPLGVDETDEPPPEAPAAAELPREPAVAEPAAEKTSEAPAAEEPAVPPSVKATQLNLPLDMPDDEPAEATAELGSKEDAA